MAQILDKTWGWLAGDFDGQAWAGIALWLVAAHAGLVLLALGVDAAFTPGTHYGFGLTLLLYAGYVFRDARQLGLGAGRASGWAALVALLPLGGAILYARRRPHLRRRFGP